MVAFLVVWGVGATLIGAFGIGLPEMIGLTLLAVGAFVLASRQTASERAATS